MSSEVHKLASADATPEDRAELTPTSRPPVQFFGSTNVDVQLVALEFLSFFDLRASMGIASKHAGALVDTVLRTRQTLTLVESKHTEMELFRVAVARSCRNVEVLRVNMASLNHSHTSTRRMTKVSLLKLMSKLPSLRHVHQFIELQGSPPKRIDFREPVAFSQTQLTENLVSDVPLSLTYLEFHSAFAKERIAGQVSFFKVLPKIEILQCHGMIDMDFVKYMPRVRDLTLRYLTRAQLEDVCSNLHELEYLSLRVPHTDEGYYDHELLYGLTRARKLRCLLLWFNRQRVADAAPITIMDPILLDADVADSSSGVQHPLPPSSLRKVMYGPPIPSWQASTGHFEQSRPDILWRLVRSVSEANE